MASDRSWRISLHTSARNLARLFAQHAQCSPLDYVQRMRVGLARELLTQGQLSVDRVAEMSGFSSAHQLATGVAALVIRTTRRHRPLKWRPCRAARRDVRIGMPVACAICVMRSADASIAIIGLSRIDIAEPSGPATDPTFLRLKHAVGAGGAAADVAFRHVEHREAGFAQELGRDSVKLLSVLK